MPKDNFTNLGLGSNEMFSVSWRSTFSLIYVKQDSDLNLDLIHPAIAKTCLCVSGSMDDNHSAGK